MEKIRLVASQLHPKCSAIFNLSGKKYEGIRIPYNPMFELCHNFDLKNDDPHLQSVLKILSGQEEDVKVSEVESTKRIAKMHFGVDLVIDPHDLSRTVLAMLVKETLEVNILDTLKADTICDAIEHAYGSINPTEHEKVDANVGKYLQSSQKTDSDKNKIRTSTAVKPRYRYREKVEDDEVRDRRDDQKKSNRHEDYHDDDRRDKEKSRDTNKRLQKVHYVEKKANDRKQSGIDIGEFEDFRQKRSKQRIEKQEKMFGREQSQDIPQEPDIGKRSNNRREEDEPRNFDDKRYFNPRKLYTKNREYDNNKGDKIPKDDRVVLGVYGQTSSWWREHNRPTRIASS